MTTVVARGSLPLEAEIGPRYLDGVESLRNYWRRSGSRWDKLRRMIIKERGAQCEICRSKREINAHEVWEYVSPDMAGLDPKNVARTLREQRDLERRLLQKAFTDRAVIAALSNIQLICCQCHVCKHSYDRKYMRHWCRVNNQSEQAFHAHYKAALERRRGAIIIAVDYAGFDELPDYKTFQEWKNATEDEAAALHEDDWIYAESEMDDSGFSRSGWINK